MTRPPLYVRRPFLAGLLRQLPLLAVLVVVGVGLLAGHLRPLAPRLVVIGLALLGAAVLRLLLPVRRVGFLAVRSRPVDVVLLAGTGSGADRDRAGDPVPLSPARAPPRRAAAGDRLPAMAEKSRQGKVTVVGAGFYGSTTALRLAEYDVFETVVLTDIVEGKPEGIALDMNQSRPIEGFETKIVGVGGGSYEGTESSDVVVITAGLPRKPGMSRMDLIETNAKIVRSGRREHRRRPRPTP